MLEYIIVFLVKKFLNGITEMQSAIEYFEGRNNFKDVAYQIKKNSIRKIVLAHTPQPREISLDSITYRTYSVIYAKVQEQ